MPIRFVHTPNVTFTRSLFSGRCLLSVLAQVVATEPCVYTSAPVKPSNNVQSRIQIGSKSHPRRSKMMETDILPVEPSQLGRISFKASGDDLIDQWDIDYDEGTHYENLKRAAKELAHTDTPVAFPTETVYGLGADATRSPAVRAIFAAKGRPADNPLIVHVHSLPQLRALLRGKKEEEKAGGRADPIPDIYKPLIQKFWPGPLTLIMPNPKDSVLAPEVTAGLNTFGARMPRSILSLSLIRLSGVPLAGPSANASTRPSPTAAEHVKDDLLGRIHTIIDGGPCEVGVESTVVDGLSYPPTILRPGGVTVDQLRRCPGWEDVVVGYKDKAGDDGMKPRAPGMKYRHYSPKASVILYEAGAKAPLHEEILGNYEKIGLIRTSSWPVALGLPIGQDNMTLKGERAEMNGISHSKITTYSTEIPDSHLSNLLRSIIQHQVPHATRFLLTDSRPLEIWDIALGRETEGVARGLFSALRELDKKAVDVIFVEGIDDHTGDDIAAAVMNRLRKAAEIRA